MTDFLAQIRSLFEGHAAPWGAVDLVVSGRGGEVDRAAQCAVVLAGMSLPDGPAFRRIEIYAPRAPEWSDPFRQAFATSLQRMAPDATDRHVEGLLTRVSLRAPPSFEAHEIVGEIRGLRPRTAVVLPNAALYRSAGLKPRAAGPPQRGDDWAPHVHGLMVGLQEGAEEGKRYAILDAGEPLPARQELQELLFSVERSAVLGAPSDEREDRFQALYRRWHALTQEGELDRCLVELHADDSLSEPNKVVVRLRLFDAAGLSQAVRGELSQNRPLLRTFDPTTRLHVARIAETHDEDAVASDLLTGVATQLGRREDLELALALAGRLRERSIARTIASELERLFPASAALRRRRATELGRAGRLRAAAEVLCQIDEEEARARADLLDSIGARVESSPTFDVPTLMRDIETRFPSAAWDGAVIIAEELIRNGREGESLDLLLRQQAALPDDPDRAASILDAIRRMALRGRLPDSGVILEAIIRVIRTVAARPSDGALRLSLIGTLAPERLGTRGVALGAVAMLRIATEPKTIRPPSPTRTVDSPSDEEQLELWMRGLEWLSKRGMVVVGTHAFPPELLQVEPDQAVAGMGRLCNAFAAEGDLHSLGLGVALLSALAPLASRPDEDLLEIRGVVSRLAQAGHSQSARDYAEQALFLAREVPRRQQLAWQCYAEAYARTGNTNEAVIGMACALALGQERTATEACEESVLIARLLRELNLRDEAREALNLARRAASLLDHPEIALPRIQTLELQLDLLECAEDKAADRGRLRSLILAAAADLTAALARHDEIAPAATLLASAMDLAHAADVPDLQEPKALLQRVMSELDANSRELIQAVMAEDPSSDQLASFIERLQPARYSEDTGFDLHHVVLLARRLLGARPLPRAEDCIYATEVLADQTLSVPTSSGEVTQGRLITSVSKAAEVARALSTRGIAIVTLGLGRRGLVRTATIEGRHGDPALEPPDTFSGERLGPWSDAYPYAYGFVEEPNVFLQTTRGLGVTDLPSRSAVVASTDLQSLPLNLLQVGDDLAGWQRRLASIPSLGWLSSMQETTAPAGQPSAWIPHERGSFETLSLLAEGLTAPLARFGITVNAERRPPETLKRAELAVVAAHGGVDSTGEFFRVVSDDSNLVLSPKVVARAVEGSGIVILFVCSAGRRDRHPSASAVLGLAKEVLGTGCHAVIAPLWPLAVSVPPIWLPAFLGAWSEGEVSIDACYLANQAVQQKFGFDPAKALAMSVYGDPLAARGSHWHGEASAPPGTGESAPPGLR